MANLIKAAEIVSQEAHFNYSDRFQFYYRPNCMNTFCAHTTKGAISQVKEIPWQIKNLIIAEFKSHKWSEALEICISSITTDQYLSASVLMHVFEIILNINEDLSCDYNVSQMIEKCKFVLSMHFTTHCPCVNTNIRKVYAKILMSPMYQNKTLSNRLQFGSSEGIFQYCLNRLQYELSINCQDGPIYDKPVVIPDDLRGTARGLRLKNKFEIFEMLTRPHRIERLMVVMRSIIELLQYDVAIFQYHKDSQLKRNRTITPIIQSLIWRERVHIRSITKNLKHIMKLFCYFVHLEYPAKHIKTMTMWVNLAIEMFYINTNKKPNTYPNIDSRFHSLINEFYEIFADFPTKSITDILEKIEPMYIRHQISHLHALNLLNSDETDTVKLLDNFYKKAMWNEFPNNKMTVIETKPIQRPNPLDCLLEVSRSATFNDTTCYGKFFPLYHEHVVDQNHVIYTLYITMQAYLYAYSIQEIQGNLEKPNESSMHGSCSSNVKNSNFPTPSTSRSHQSYTTPYQSYPTPYQSYITSKVIKKYKYITNSFCQLILTIREKMTCNDKPESLCIIERLLNIIQ